MRALEFLLGAVAAGDSVATVGATGSTHALATARYAGVLGARTTVFRWPQVMNEAARRVDAELRSHADVRDSRSPVQAYIGAAMHRLRHRPHWIPAGGTTPLGILGHVDAGLEFAAQVADGVMPPPRRIVIPLGSGGTVAGLLLALAISGLDCEVVGVQVVPRIVANRRRVARLVAATRMLLEKLSDDAVGAPDLRRLTIDRGFYGGAYGRETVAGRDAASRYRAAHPAAMLDGTYAAKTCAAALARCDGQATVFWVTFDSRVMGTPTG